MLSGGGARAAYQVGCLRYLARAMPAYRPSILTGVSAGAINAAHLAAFRGNWPDAVSKLSQLWLSINTQNIYATDLSSLLRPILGWGLQVMTAGWLGTGQRRGMVDNRALKEFLCAALPNERGRLSGIADNLAEGLLESLAIITTNYGSGQSVAWVEGGNTRSWSRGQLRANNTKITVDHIMASSALPLFFPAVKLGRAWHGDGGVRLTAPLSPAMHMGATRILAVSPRATPTQALPIDQREPYPAPAQIAGTLLNAVFLDMLDYDALQMNRINQLLAKLPQEAHGSYRPVEVFVLRPREDLGVLAREHEIKLPSAFRFFEKGLRDQRARSADALSMVIFEPEYLALLMRLGEEDTAARHDEIAAFLNAEHSPGALQESSRQV